MNGARGCTTEDENRGCHSHTGQEFTWFRLPNRRLVVFAGNLGDLAAPCCRSYLMRCMYLGESSQKAFQLPTVGVVLLDEHLDLRLERLHAQVVFWMRSSICERAFRWPTLKAFAEPRKKLFAGFRCGTLSGFAGEKKQLRAEMGYGLLAKFSKVHSVSFEKSIADTSQALRGRVPLLVLLASRDELQKPSRQSAEGGGVFEEWGTKQLKRFR